MSLQRVQQVEIAAPRPAVWQVLMTPSLWPAFDDAIQRCEPAQNAAESNPAEAKRPTAYDAEAESGADPGLATQLVEGQKIRVIPHAPIRGSIHAWTAPPATVVEVHQNIRLAWQQDQPGGFTRVTWSLIDTADGLSTVVERRIEAQGPMGATGGGVALASPLDGDLTRVGARLQHMAGEPAVAGGPLVVIAGGSGYLSQRLAHTLLARGRRVVILTRSKGPRGLVPHRVWDGATLGEWADVFADPEGVSVVNLVGPRLFAKVTPQALAEARTARVNAARVLAQAAAGATDTRGWVQASALPLTQDENAPAFEAGTRPDWAPEGITGMAHLLHEWEASAPTSATLVRSGAVLGQGSPALRALKSMAGARLRPTANPWLAWIHTEDWLRVALGALEVQENERHGGATAPRRIVASTPGTLRLDQALKTLAGGTQPDAPWLSRTQVKVPDELLRASGAVVGLEADLMLCGVNAVSNVVEELGPVLAYPTFEAAAATF